MKDRVCKSVILDYHYKERAVGGDYSQSLLARKCDPTENENGTL